MITLRRKAKKAINTRLIRNIAGWCLQYPDSTMLEKLPLLREGVEAVTDEECRAWLTAVLDHLGGKPQNEAAQHYVDAFDSRPRRCLYLTWYADGDTRRRGASLVRLKQIYRAHGMVPSSAELPDFLPVLLEFATTGGPAATEAGEELLTEFRPGLRLLADNLGKFGSPYEGAVRAVLATLPQGGVPLPMAQPVEQVGIDPYPTSFPGARR
ncbi:nitrate reductase molybdenum cofactor assembly chaperone [Allokutzneria oryzae]|uniref:Nitrate reductase molybdenum cofactor assembly chaperone n=1 Tax=Allokutzneria oryzae TaxID=1378989 RepID=A0ABV5ZYM0_9PSEU